MIDSKRLTAWYNLQAPAYHFWRDNYDSPLVHQVAQLIHNGSVKERRYVLDAGCGSGLFTIGLAKQHEHCTVVGIDPSAGLLRIGRKQALKRNISNATFIEGDVMSLPHQDDSVDVVVAAGLFPNINDHVAALTELRRVLRPGGQVVVVEFDRMTMTKGTKLFFNGMIAAYKMVSSVLRRYRFADEWNIESSTIDCDLFCDQLNKVGLKPMPPIRTHNHLIFHCLKSER